MNQLKVEALDKARRAVKIALIREVERTIQHLELALITREIDIKDLSTTINDINASVPQLNLQKPLQNELYALRDQLKSCNNLNYIEKTIRTLRNKWNNIKRKL